MTSKLSSATDLLLPGFKEQGCVSKTLQQDGPSLHQQALLMPFLYLRKRKTWKKKEKQCESTQALVGIRLKHSIGQDR